MDVIAYLNEQLDDNVEMKPFKALKKLPLFLTNEYKFSECRIHDLDCVLMEKKDAKFSINKITKHLLKMKEFGVERPVLIFTDLDSGKRRKLVINRVPFIVPGKQLYLPFIYINFTEKVAKFPNKIDKFTAATQMIFIRILLGDEKEIVTRELGEALGLTMMTINRGIRQLVTLGIVEEIGLGTKKKYFRLNRKLCWEAGKKYMINPISKVKYLKFLSNEINPICSSDSALSALTMMNSGRDISYALDKLKFDKIEPALVIKESDVDEDLECVRVERWKYDPDLFSKQGNIDVFSLYAIYQEDNDPRIEIEFEGLIEEALCEEQRRLVHISDEVASLSAILLNSDYYNFLLEGKKSIDGLSILDELRLIPFKAKAWCELTDRQNAGEEGLSKHIKKHRNDVAKLLTLLSADVQTELHGMVESDMIRFVEAIGTEVLDAGVKGMTTDLFCKRLQEIYRL